MPDSRQPVASRARRIFADGRRGPASPVANVGADLAPRSGSGCEHRRVERPPPECEDHVPCLWQRLREHMRVSGIRAVGADLDVRGFQVAVDDALLVRGLEGVGDLPGDGQGVGERNSARGGRLFRAGGHAGAEAPVSIQSGVTRDDRREVLALDQFHDEESDDGIRGSGFGRTSSPMPKRVAMFGWFSDANVCASRVKRATRSPSCATTSGRILMATSRLSFVSRAR